MKDNYLLKKWLNNELNESETEAFKNLDEYNEYSKIIDSAKNFKASSFANVDDYNTFKHKLPHKNNVKQANWIKPILRIASVLVLGVCTYLIFFNSSLTKIDTSYSEKITFNLPDKSQVTLNALSHASFNEKKWKEKREISLEGEAFFDVAKGAVFDVITPEGTVQVVGTEFNVKQRDNYFEVTCFEGKVKVTSQQTTKELLVGDTFRMYQGSFSFDSHKNDNPQWLNNMSDFKQIPLKEAITELERQYNLIIDTNNIDTSLLFTGRFVHDNLENALQSITQPLNLTYKIENKNKVRLLKREP